MTTSIRLATALIAAVVALLVLPATLPAAEESASPTVTVDAPVSVSTSTTAEAEATISDGTLVLTGTATDPDGISHLTVAREYRYDTDREGIEPGIDRYYATPDASNGTFRHEVPLGTGTNEVNLSVVDGAGYPTQVDIVVHVDDKEPPTAHRLSATPDGEWVRIEGWVRDNVQVAEVRAAGQTLQTQTGERDLDREDVRLDHRVPRPDSDTLTVTLVDQAGTSREVVLPVGGEGTPTAAPTATPTETPAPTAAATPATTPTASATAAGTPAATPPPVRTPTPTPNGSGGTSPLGLLGVVIVIGAALAMLSVGGGGW